MGHKNGYYSMKSNKPATRKNKEEIIRARCDSSLKQSIYNVAMLQQLDPSDIIRMACAAYVNRFCQPHGGVMHGQ